MRQRFIKTLAEKNDLQLGDVDENNKPLRISMKDLGIELPVMVNTNGVLGSPSFIESGVAGEYALNSGDMNNDGISDLVVGGQDS